VPLLTVKDPDHPKALPKDRKRFLDELRSDVLLALLRQKLRDSLLYRWAEEKLDKPVHYVVLLQFSALGRPDLLVLAEKLKKALPLDGPKSGTWRRRLVESVTVLDVAAWNAIGRLGQVRRI
jgi:hypothetical protein